MGPSPVFNEGGLDIQTCRIYKANKLVHGSDNSSVWTKKRVNDDSKQ